MAEMKPWQKGYPLDELQRVTAIFRASDDPFIHGAYGALKENAVADAQSRGQLRVSPTGQSAMVLFRPKRAQPVKDFADAERAIVGAGELIVKRLGCFPDGEDELFQGLQALVEKGPAYVHIWQESELHREMVDSLGLEHVATKVTAASELVGIYSTESWDSAWQVKQGQSADRPGITKIAAVPDDVLMEGVSVVGDVPEMAQHYSSYNKGGAWTALSLRGYSDDPAFIIKPAEMSKQWKDNNKDLLEAEIRDTPLRQEFPELEPLISLVPGFKQRIRLMRLEPGGGELTRHADITDPDAGTRDECVMRIHIPLVSNPEVLFEQWLLDGSKQRVHMSVGGVWYLDTRKPHTAKNAGEEARVHLVMDVFANDKLRAALMAGAEKGWDL